MVVVSNEKGKILMSKKTEIFSRSYYNNNEIGEESIKYKMFVLLLLLLIKYKMHDVFSGCVINVNIYVI